MRRPFALAALSLGRRATPVLVSVLLSAAVPAVAGAAGLTTSAAVVAVDPDFAPVAQLLTRAFTERTGHELELALRQGAQVPAEADVLLASDATLPARLAAEGLAAPETLVTYAMGPTGTPQATHPRDAVLMIGASDNAVARDFIAFLMTPDAWDLIVTHGYGAY